MTVHVANLSQGECVKDDNRRQLFASPYLSPFDPDAYLEEHPELAPESLRDNDGNVLPHEGPLPIQVQLAANAHAAQYAVMVAAAKQICASCPVLDLCRQWALEHNEAIYGVVGGMTETERYQHVLNTQVDDEGNPRIMPVSSASVIEAAEEADFSDITRALQAELG